LALSFDPLKISVIAVFLDVGLASRGEIRRRPAGGYPA